MSLCEERFGLRPAREVHDKLVAVFGQTPRHTLDAWVERLASRDADDVEWLGVVEDLTVHETYFFRDEEQLDFLRNRILVPLIRERRARADFTLRIWSAACATGEETYTIAMLLLDAMRELGEATEELDGSIVLPLPWSVEVVGTDVARPVLRTAATGTYVVTEYGSFRQLDASRWGRLFEDAAPPEHAAFKSLTWRRPKDCVRRLVRFRPHNLCDATPPGAAFDVVTCRNVFIYFDAPSQARAERTIARALAPGGALVMGPTDRLMRREHFAAAWHENFLYFVRTEIPA